MQKESALGALGLQTVLHATSRNPAGGLHLGHFRLLAREPSLPPRLGLRAHAYNVWGS